MKREQSKQLEECIRYQESIAALVARIHTVETLRLLYAIAEELCLKEPE